MRIQWETLENKGSALNVEHLSSLLQRNIKLRKYLNSPVALKTQVPSF